LYRFVKLLTVVLAALAMSCAVISSASAAGKHAIHCKGVTVSSGVLQLGGVLSNAEDLEGALRVKATREGRKPYFLPRGDLVSKTSIVHRIGPGHVKITNPEFALPYDPKKDKGRWRSIPVAVKDVHFAGEYEGRLELGSGGCKVDFNVLVVGAAEISLVGTGEKAVKLKFARCRFLTCGPGDFLACLNSPSSRRDQVEVQVDNASQVPADVTAVQVALNSEAGEEIVPDAAFTPPGKPFTLPPQQATALPPIGIKRGEIAPGHYTGAIYLTVAGAEKRIGLPFELDLKDGPFWAIVALVAALLVQLGQMLATRTQPRKQELREVAAVRKKALAKLNGEAALLEGCLEKAHELALGGKLDDAKAACTAIEEDIGLVEEALALEAKAKEKGSQPSGEVEKLLAEFREAIESGKGKDADSRLSDLRVSVSRRDANDRVAAETAGTPATLKAGDGKRSPGTAAPISGARGLTVWFVAAWEALSDTARWLSIYVLPWLLRGVLVAAFLLTGLKELYFSNSTFGAQYVVDYGGLFLWGLTAAGLNTVLGKIVPGAGKE
jgi:DNA-binding Xre family transcriptional regulator